MSTITEFGLNQSEAWDGALRSLPESNVFCRAEYARAYAQENPANGSPLLLLYENGDDRAVNVIFRRDVAADPHFLGKLEPGKYLDLTTPYGYGGFIGHVSRWDELNQAYNEYCAANRIICEFVRFDLFSDYMKHYDGTATTRTHNVVRTLDLSMDELWMDFKPKVRKNVKRAQKNNLGMIITSSDDHLEDFLRIYYGTMARTEAEQHFFFSERFFRTLNEMRDHVMYFYTTHEDRVISAELVLYDAVSCYSYLGGTDSAFFDLRPNDFLKYHVIQWAREKNLKRFVLGGGYGADDGIFQYKLSLAPNGVHDFYIGRKVFDHGAYDYLTQMRGEGVDSRFFPIYRS